MTGRAHRALWALALGAAGALGLRPTPAPAGELPGCFVGARPCGTPEALARTLARCLADPAACGTLERAAPASRVATPAPVVGDAPVPPTASLHGPPRRAARSASGAASGSASDAGAAREPVRDAERIEVAARALPLDAALRDLRDALPPDVAAVERRLGLRRPLGGAVTDLRGAGVPSAEAILRALLPP